MSDPRLTTKPTTTATPKPAPAAPKAAPTVVPPAAPKVAGDTLSLSAAARQAPPPGRSGAGTNVRVEATDRDVTLEAQLGERTRLVARQITGSPTMMDGASLLKIEHDLGDHTTAFAGAGNLPGFYSHSIGPNQREAMPHVAAFAGVEDVRGTRKELGLGLDLDLRLQSLAVATVGYNQATRKVDAATSAGLSKATVTGEMNLSKRFGAVEASVGYGHHVDLGHVGSYYMTGGDGVAPRTHWVQGGVGTRAAGVDLRLDAYVPIETASNEFSDQAKVRASVGGHRYLPEVGVTMTTGGLERVDAMKALEIAPGWEAAATVSAWRPLSGRPEIAAGVGVRWTPGKKASSRPATRRADDWRAQAPTPRAQADHVVDRPRLAQWFTPMQIAAMRGKPVEELAKTLRTPEQVVAYLAQFVTYDDDRLKDSKGDYGSLTPNEVASLLKGVCRDQHAFMLSVMQEGQGVEGRQIGYMSPDTSHAIGVYRDPGTGKWNVIEYGRIHRTEAATAEQAFEAVRPDALVYGDWSQGGPDEKNHQRTIRYSETAREYYRFVQPSKR